MQGAKSLGSNLLSHLDNSLEGEKGTLYLVV
jgi:hypothetical protein